MIASRLLCKRLAGIKFRYITSDCDAVATIFEYQHFVKTREEAVADALKAGYPFCLLFDSAASLHCICIQLCILAFLILL